MGNLARNPKQEEQRQYQPQKQTVQAPKKSIDRKSWLSPGEKIIGLVFAGLVCFGAVQMVTTQAAIYDANKEIQQAEQNIQEQTRVINDLEVQVGELSTYERMLDKANQLGLNMNENNVKVVHD